MTEFKITDIKGSGGGGVGSSAPASPGGSGKSGAQGVESPNTLRSNAFARIVELICEGPIDGLVNGGQSVYFNQTPVVNANGTVNYRGVTWDSRNGLPDQPGLYGNSTAENTVTVGVQQMASITPTVVTIVDAEASMARVIVRVPALYSEDKNGNIVATGISYEVECKAQDGPWTTVDSQTIYGKCTSAYQQESTFALPAGGGPWEIRVTRLSPDSYTTNLQNELWFDSYTAVVNGNFMYPNSALCEITVNAELFQASAIPSRTFHVRGLIIQVPTNYDTTTRQYNGIWDGTFKSAYSNNPAWVFYDLLVSNRYGIGDFIDTAKVDKWGLYAIAQYCDELVPDGFGGVEPRYTFNGVINNRQEAFKAIQAVTSSFRGMAFWAAGQVFATCDMPTDAVKLVTPANVIDGRFNYSGSSLKSRHSVALVRWNDPTAFYSPAMEVVVSDPQLLQYGWRELQMSAIGCTSRGQANRMGRWALDTERYSTETIEYSASWDHIDIRPGDVIAVADPNKNQVRLGGRIVNAINATTIVMDQPFSPDGGVSYSLMVELPDGTIGTSVINSFTNGDTTVSLNTALSQTPINGAMFALTSSETAPREYRVLTIVEDNKHNFKVTALIYDPTKYNRVEALTPLAPIQYSRPKTTINPPANIAVNETVYYQNGVAQNRITISWTPSDDFMAAGYGVTGQGPAGGANVNFGQTNGTSIDISNPDLGAWTFYVQSVGYDGRVSTYATVQFNVQGWAAMAPPYVTNLEIHGQGNDYTFTGQDCHVTWQNNFPGSTDDVGQSATIGATSQSPFYKCNQIQIVDPATGTVLRTEFVNGTDYIYTYDKNVTDNAIYNRGAQRSFTIKVTVLDTLGRISDPVAIVATNPAPALMVPTLTPGADCVFVTYVIPTDPDFVGVMVWCDANANYDPMTTTPTYQGPSNMIILPGITGETLYVRIAAYDLFGTSGLNISPPTSVIVGGVSPFTVAPSIPTNLALSSAAETLSTGEIQEILTASWDVSPSGNFAYFDVQVQEGTGSFISYQTALNTYTWNGLKANQSYSVKVRAFSISGFPSAFCSPVSTTMPAKMTPPGVVTGLEAVNSLKSVFLVWVNPTDSDLDHIEIWSSATNDQTTATLAGTSYGTAFTIAGLATGVQQFFWARAVNTSSVAGSYSASVSATPGAVTNTEITAGTIAADRLIAGSITGNLLNISTYLPATITVGTSGVSIGDPAALINHNATTQISAGLIQISGATTLSSWTDGTDATKISGGAISANSIAANSLTIGNRNLSIAGLQFSFNSTTNALSWTNGSISYWNDAGSYALVNIAAGSATVIGGALYVTWAKDATTLATSGTYTASANTLLFCTYTSSSGMVATYGRTIIDGSSIVANSIQGAQIAAGTIVANNIAANAITASQIAAGTITGDRIAANAITANNIATGSITADSIAIGAVGASALSADALAAIAGIPDGAITSIKIADNAVTAGKIAANSIGANQIIANSITSDRMSVGTLSALSANVGSLNAGKIYSTDGMMVIDLDDGYIVINGN